MQLQSENDKLREELERERNDRNFFQAESQRVHTFWEITKRELEERNCTLRNVQAAVDESEEAHQKEIKV
jgi:hypothetical protein